MGQEEQQTMMLGSCRRGDGPALGSGSGRCVGLSESLARCGKARMRVWGRGGESAAEEQIC